MKVSSLLKILLIFPVLKVKLDLSCIKKNKETDFFFFFDENKSEFQVKTERSGSAVMLFSFAC